MWINCARDAAACPCRACSCLLPLRNEATPAKKTYASCEPPAVQSETLVLQPSATIMWPACTSGKPPPDTPQFDMQCTKESRDEGGRTVLLVPPSLNDTHLLPFLKGYEKVSAAGGKSMLWFP